MVTSTQKGHRRMRARYPRSYSRRGKRLRSIFCGIYLLLLFAPTLLSAAASDPPPVAFVDVNIVPMDRERIVEHQTVITEKGKISQIGSAGKISLPADAIRIDGRGFYLMPGLADMHFHLHTRQDALLCVLNGVTTIRNMRGTPLHLAWKKQIEQGTLLAPTIYTAGPILDGYPPSGESVTVIRT